MSVAVIDYGSGNLRSVAKALAKAAGGTGRSIHVTQNASDLKNASHIVLPGVGAYADCMAGLQSIPGMLDALEAQVRGNKKPFLGICVGMQMLFEKGHEHGTQAGLGWLAGEVVPIAPEAGLKVPHMGWNALHIERPHALLSGIEEGAHAYFVHGYHAMCADASDVCATTDYGQKRVAVVARGNIMGTQFHPEKSQETGLKLLGNFLKI